MLQLQHLPVLLLCAHAALLENFTLEIAAIFQNVRRRLAVNKLSSPNNLSSYVRKLSMSLVQNISQIVNVIGSKYLTKGTTVSQNVIKRTQCHEYKLLSAAMIF